MCGICGISHADITRPVDDALLHRMNEMMLHRGPDEDGFFNQPGIGLAMRRLAIVDLTSGQQPMHNEDGTVTVVFNGEIYNHEEIRAELKARGHVFHTNSDTEVLPHLYEEYGLDFPHHLNGMFGIALWDHRRKRLVLVRDRMGIKPVYYAQVDGSLVFASELRTILQYPGIDRSIDLTAFSEYLTFQHALAPRTLVNGVRKIPAGHLALYEGGELYVRKYWDLRFGPDEGIGLTEDEYVEQFREHFQRSVQRRLMSDVPLGVFLSGGLDSSAIVGMLARLGAADRKSYALGYAEGDIYGELGYATMVANVFKTDHQEVILSSEQYMAALPRFALYIDDPINDDAGLLFMLLSERARQDVTVILSGQGADETLGGYTLGAQQARFDRIRQFQRVPRWLRYSLPGAFESLLPSGFNDWLKRGNADLATFNQHDLHTLAWQFEEDDKRRFIPPLKDVAPHCHDIIRDSHRAAGTHDPMRQIFYNYIKIALAENLLMHGDKMTMAHSIELRVPFLDHELVEFEAQVPSRYMVRREPDGSYTTKNLLNRAMRGILPDKVIRRPKAAFPIPLKEWFQQALAANCRQVLLSDSARESGLYDIDEVAALLDRHIADPQRETTLQIKNLLFFEMWRNEVLGAPQPQASQGR